MKSDMCEVIDWKIIETADEVLKKCEATSVPNFLAIYLTLLAKKIYESAPSCEQAELMFEHSLRTAKEMYTQE